MAFDDPKESRRNFLLQSGVALTGLLGTSGTAAAFPGRGRHRGRKGRAPRGPPERTGPPEWARFEDGELSMAVSQAEWNSIEVPETPGIPDEARRVPYEAVEAALEEINRAVAAGEAEYRQGGAKIDFNPDEGSSQRREFDDL